MCEQSGTLDLVELTRRSFETGNRRDFNLLSSFFAPDAVFDMSQVGMGRFEGLAAIREFLEDWWGAYDEFEAEAEEVRDLGNGVTFAVILQAGRPIGSSGDVSLRYAAVNLFVAGAIVQTTNYLDVDEGRAAAERLAESRESASSRENVEKLRALFETWATDTAMWHEAQDAWRRGEADMSLFDPDVTYDDTVLPDHIGETYYGHEGVLRAAERWIEPFEWLAIELLQIVQARDRLVSTHRWRAKARHSGLEFDTPLAYVWTFRDGRVIHFRSYLDPDQALEAARAER
jgi:ketosteroid isomerase-like protein